MIDGWMYGGDCNILIAFLKKRGDKNMKNMKTKYLEGLIV